VSKYHTMSDKKRDRAPIRIGVSSCLLGIKVRYDGGHKRDPSLTRALGRFVTWVPVCPEVECGMGTPREPMRLVGKGRARRLVTVTTGRDLTARMRRYARGRVDALAADDLCGYVLKSRSPSCGVDGVPIHDSRGRVERPGRGLFTALLMERFPLLPVVDEERLRGPGARDHFIERVLAYRRLRDLFGSRWTVRALARFHAANTLALMARSPEGCRRLARLVARAREVPRARIERLYAEGFTKALATITTPAGAPRRAGGR